MKRPELKKIYYPTPLPEEVFQGLPEGYYTIKYDSVKGYYAAYSKKKLLHRIKECLWKIFRNKKIK